MNHLIRYGTVVTLLLMTTSITAMHVANTVNSYAVSLTPTNTIAIAKPQLTDLTLSSTGFTLAVPATSSSTEAKEATVTLRVIETIDKETVVSERAVPCSYIAEHSMVVALFAPSDIPTPPLAEDEKNYQQALLCYQRALHLYMKALAERHAATLELVDKCNDGHYLKTRFQLDALVASLDALHHKPTKITMRTFVTALADTLITRAELDTDDFVALWTAAQYLAIQPISAACALGLANSQTPLPSTLVLPRPLSTHLKAELSCKKNKDATAMFNVLDECCLLEDVKGEKPLTTAKIWASWRQHPRVEILLAKLPRSQQKSELISNYIIDHVTARDFDFDYWYDQMLPGRGSLSPRSNLLSTLTTCARTLVNKQSKQVCATLPEGYFKILVRQAYLQTYNTPLDNFPIEAIQQRFSSDTETITLSGLNLTSLIGIDTMLTLRNEAIPIQRLLLNANQFTTLPNGFGKSLHALQELNIADNKIASPPADFGQTWKYLQILELSHNQINGLASNFGHTWSYFSFLNLNDNLLTAIPTNLGKTWKNMSLIKLDNNKLPELPMDFGSHWPTVGLINLENNPCSNQPTSAFSLLVRSLRKRGIKVLI